MSPSQLRELIIQAFPGAAVEVQDLTGTGDHFQAVIAADQFTGLSMLKQHRLVNDALRTYIDDGRVHALALKTYTPEQWRESFVQFG